MVDKKKIIVGGGILGAAAAAYFLTRKVAAEFHYCPYCDAGFATYEELMAHIAAEHPTEEDVGRVQGYVIDGETGSKIANAKIYVDGVFHAYSVAPYGNYRTNYVSWGSHTIKVEADNYEMAEFPVTLEESLMSLDLEMLPLEEAPTEWTEGIKVRKITVEPSTAYVGETIEIKVYIDYPTPLPPLPVTIQGSVLVNEILLTDQWILDFYDTTFLFTYTPTQLGTYTARAQDKSAHFEVLQDIADTYYMPWGGVRMPVCTEWVNGECVAWNPVAATVSTYVVREGWWPGQLVAMAVDYSCKEYWDTKDELVSMIASGLGHNPVPPLDEWVVQYGKTCPTCEGSGKVVCVPTIHGHCRAGDIITCPTCRGDGIVLLVDLNRGWRDWIKAIRYHSVCGAGSCTPSIRCPYCDQKIYGPSHTRGLSWDKESFVRTVLLHIETNHPNHPLTEPR